MSSIVRFLYRCSVGFKSGLVNLKLLKCGLGCMPQVIVMLTDESLHQPQVVNTLKQVSFKNLSAFGCIHPSFKPKNDNGHLHYSLYSPEIRSENTLLLGTLQAL